MLALLYDRVWLGHSQMMMIMCDEDVCEDEDEDEKMKMKILNGIVGSKISPHRLISQIQYIVY